MRITLPSKRVQNNADDRSNNDRLLARIIPDTCTLESTRIMVVAQKNAHPETTVECRFTASSTDSVVWSGVHITGNTALILFVVSSVNFLTFFMLGSSEIAI